MSELYCPLCELEKKKAKMKIEINAESKSCYKCPECKRVYNVDPLLDDLILGC